MNKKYDFSILEFFVPNCELYNLKKVSVYYAEIKWLKWISIFNLTLHKRYFLKVTFKDKTVKHILISNNDKVKIVPYIIDINFNLMQLSGRVK